MRGSGDRLTIAALNRRRSRRNRTIGTPTALWSLRAKLRSPAAASEPQRVSSRHLILDRPEDSHGCWSVSVATVWNPNSASLTRSLTAHFLSC